MVADKHRMTASQAAAMGMLSPAAGLGIMRSVLTRAQAVRTSAEACGVLGGASARYWQLLLKAARQRPPLFEDVAATAHMQVITLLRLSLADHSTVTHAA